MSEGKRGPWFRWPAGSAREQPAAEPGAAMFRGLRGRLTLWYSGVLAAALILFGTALYFGTQQMLFAPVRGDLTTQADIIGQQWQAAPDGPCPLPQTAYTVVQTASFVVEAQDGRPMSAQQLKSNTPVQRIYTIMQPRYIVACSKDGVIHIHHRGPMQPPGPPAAPDNGYLNGPVAWGHDSSSFSPVITIVHTGGNTGDLYWYSQAVPDPRGGHMLGVVQVGEPISERVNALHILLILLLSVGALSLFGASAGGLLLADRALAPVRWAFKRQQDFIADASHELRTPLALLRADAEVLLRGRERLHLTEEDATLLEDIIAESAHMGALATNMLTLARLDAGQLHLEHEVINLGDLADGAHD
jgi:hypothetical protein